MKINMKNILTLLAVYTFTFFSLNAQTLTVTHTTKGEMAAELELALGETAAAAINELIVTGDAYIDYDDCRAIREKFAGNTAGKFTLDLSQAKFENDSIPGKNETSAGAFYPMLSLAEVKIPDNIRIIGYRAFRHCDNLKTINLNEGLEKIMDYSFQMNNGTRPFNIPNLPNTVEYIGAGAFENAKNLKLTALPLNLKGTIAATTFKATGVSCTEFPVGVTAINGSTSTSSGAFNCIAASVGKFKEITFHSGITSIGNHAFRTQQAITKLTFESSVPPIADNAKPFDNIPAANITVTVPKGAKDVYEAHIAFAGMNIVEAEDETKTITRENKQAGDYGTICLPGASVEITNATIYQVSGITKNGDNPQMLYLTDAVETMEAGVAYIYKVTSEGDVTFTYNSSESVEPVAINGLIGALEATPVAQNENNYILATDNKWYLVNSDYTCGANFAYLKLDDVTVLTEPPAGTRAFLNFDDNATHIDVEKTGMPSRVDVYNFQGVKIRKQIENTKALEGLEKGIYIVDGKKVAVF